MRFIADVIASPATTSSTTMTECIQFRLKRNHAPPTAMAIKPNAAVLNGLRSYFPALPILMAPNTGNHNPLNRMTNGIIRTQLVTIAAK